MFLKLNICFVFASIISGISSIEVKDLYSINEVSKYINNIHKDTYLIRNQEATLLKDEEKLEVLNNTFYHMVTILTELNIVKNSDEDFRHADFRAFLEMIDIEKVKFGHSGKSLSAFATKLEGRISSFDVYIKTLSNMTFSNLYDYCGFLPKLLNFVNADYKKGRVSIRDEYFSLVTNIEAQMKDNFQHNFCHKSISFHKGVFDYFRHAIIAYLERTIMIYHLNVIDMKCTSESTPSRVTSFLKAVINNCRKMINETKSLLQKIKHSTFKCDQSKNKTYYELEKMIQTVIIKEEDLTTDNSCSHNCDLEYIRPTMNVSECADYLECRYIEGSYDICEADKNSSRRYDFFEDEAEKLYGNSTGNCTNKMVQRYSKLSFTKFRWCDYCVCTCLKKPSTDLSVIAAINFREQVSDISKNLVVVGVKFVQRNLMIHVQIKEGKIRPNSSDLGIWKETEEIFVNRSDGFLYAINNDETQSLLISGIDYGLPEKLNFDNLIAPEGFVLTGVRFKKNNDSMQLQIRVTPFDFFTGELEKDIKQTKWIEPDSKNRTELVLVKPDLPTRSPVNNLDSKLDQFVRFQVSDLEKDAGQSTVPFFDGQEAGEDYESPLGGLGIIHRGQEGFGGFLAFRVHDLDLTKFFNSTY